MSQNILRMKAISARSGHCRSTIYRYQKIGLLTAMVKIGMRSVGLPELEIDAINAARIAGKSENEIRSLVIKLESDREVSA